MIPKVEPRQRGGEYDRSLQSFHHLPNRTLISYLPRAPMLGKAHSCVGGQSIKQGMFFYEVNTTYPIASYRVKSFIDTSASLCYGIHPRLG